MASTIFTIVIIKFLFAVFIGFSVFKLISGQTNLKKPTELAKRPKWFLGLGIGIVLSSVIFSSPTSQGLNPTDSLITYLVLVVSYSLIGMIFVLIGYFIYKNKVS